ncbi:unnamed protein product [Notodromas monacha]|uniref:RRM domain-containing protein n=1 Tax=Notodromas monacha TaxID=399045 RepID=A0A7R9BSJ1_9CRUS|nr:unnamed protein product [Notodromas monacha]CAG0920930.1 unnamed protein product [Notodromas monacha]
MTGSNSMHSLGARNCLLIRNLVHHLTADDLFKELTQVIDGLSSVLVRNSTVGIARLYYLDFETFEAAALAKKNLSLAELPFCDGKVIVEWAEEFNVGLSTETAVDTEDYLKSTSPIGSQSLILQTSVLVRNSTVGIARLYYLDFETFEAAALAKKNLSLAELPFCDGKVIVEWAEEFNVGLSTETAVYERFPDMPIDFGTCWPVSRAKPIPHQKIRMIPVPGQRCPNADTPSSFPHRTNVRIDSDEPDESTDEDELSFMREREEFLQSLKENALQKKSGEAVEFLAS